MIPTLLTLGAVYLVGAAFTAGASYAASKLDPGMAEGAASAGVSPRAVVLVSALWWPRQLPTLLRLLALPA